MMGERRVRQDALFYEFSLERHVDTSKYHICRRLEGFSGCSRGGADW
jgi:hypothetical protein